MTGRAIAKAFALLVNVYGTRFDIPSDPARARTKADVWGDLLSDIPDDVGLAAFRAYCAKHGDWPPAPAHIRDLAQVNLQLPAPGEAWAEVWGAARREGFCDGLVPPMSHPEIRAAAEATPWFRICLANNEQELSFAQRDFMSIYRGLAERTERETARTAIEGAAPKQLLPKIKRVDDAVTDGGHDD
jgi:hypothetical protein